jgi:glycosyltransferase involved in cell wall biosynthesis
MISLEAKSISAVIPTFNQTDLLLRAVKSAYGQSLPCNEIIVVDDNSDFDVKDFLIKEGYQDIVVIKNSENMGPSYSRNIGVNLASSEYISFLDSDDYWHKDKNIEMIALFKDADISLAYASQFAVNKSNEISKIIDKKYSGNVLKNLADGWIPPNPSSLMIKKEDYLEVGGMDINLWSCEDVDFWIRLSLNEKKVSYKEECLSYFSDDSDIRLSYNIEKRLSGTKFFLNKWSQSKDHSQFVIKFSKNYWVSVMFPIVIKEITSLRIYSALKLFIVYLVFNRFFYLRFFKKIIKILKS